MHGKKQRNFTHVPVYASLVQVFYSTLFEQIWSKKRIIMIIILIGSSIFTWLFVQKNLVIFLKFSSCSKLNLAFDDDEFDDNVYFFCF